MWIALVLLGVAGLAILDNSLRSCSNAVALEELQSIVNRMSYRLYEIERNRNHE